MLGDNQSITNVFFAACRNLAKTLAYLEQFARFKEEENIKAVERLLNSHTELEMFERSQLGMIPPVIYHPQA